MAIECGGIGWCQMGASLFSLGVRGMKEAAGEVEPQVFVIHFWPQAGVARGWRGRVEHIPSGKRYPIQDLAELQSLIERWLYGSADGDEEGPPRNR